MKISEFVNECHEYLANEQWMSSSFCGRSFPENTRPELGGGQSMVWLQGQPCDLSNEDVVATVLAWTDWNPNVISRKELLNAYMGFDYDDRELEMEWL
jgi:hypothetical protein